VGVVSEQTSMIRMIKWVGIGIGGFLLLALLAVALLPRW